MSIAVTSSGGSADTNTAGATATSSAGSAPANEPKRIPWTPKDVMTTTLALLAFLVSLNNTYHQFFYKRFDVRMSLDGVILKDQQGFEIEATFYNTGNRPAIIRDVFAEYGGDLKFEPFVLKPGEIVVRRLDLEPATSVVAWNIRRARNPQLAAPEGRVMPVIGEDDMARIIGGKKALEIAITAEARDQAGKNYRLKSTAQTEVYEDGSVGVTGVGLDVQRFQPE